MTPVTVALRIRPSDNSGTKGSRSVVDILSEKSICIDSRKQFTFDAVYSGLATQTHLFSRSALPLVDKFIDGFNATILAYGQSGSGKTFTMGLTDLQDDAEFHGIVPRAAKHIFDTLSQVSDNQYSITASFLEVYNEDLLDLLNQPSIKEKKANPNWYHDAIQAVSIREKDGLVSWTGQSEIPVSSVDQHFEGQDGGDWQILESKISFVDLAGSERLKRTGSTGFSLFNPGERQKEGISINSGLMALGNVIFALSDDKIAHVPYRESKLTRLLQDSLGGNSQTMMIACISPCHSDMAETLNTLKYANRARNIKNSASINSEYNSKVAALYAEIAKLKQELTGWQSGQVYEQIEETVAQNDNLRIQVAQLTEENAELQQHSDFYANELALLQSENTLGMLNTPQSISPNWETHSEASSSAFSQSDSVNTSSSIPIPSRVARRTTIHHTESSSKIDSDRLIRKLRSDIREVTAVANSYSAQLDVLSGKLAAAESANTILSQRETSNHAYVAQLESKLKESDSQIQSQTKLIDDLKAQVSNLNHANDSAEDYIKGLETQLHKQVDLENQVAMLENELRQGQQREAEMYENAEFNLENWKRSFTTRIQKISEKEPTSTVSSELNELILLLEGLGAVVTDDGERYGGNSRESSILEFDREAVLERIRSLEEELTVREAEIEAQKAKNSEITAKLESIDTRSERSVLEKNVVDSYTDTSVEYFSVDADTLTDADDQVLKIEAENRQLKSSVSELESRNELLSSQIKSLESRVENQSTESSREPTLSEVEIEELIIKQQQSTQRVEELHLVVQKLESNCKELESYNADLKNQLHTQRTASENAPKPTESVLTLWKKLSVSEKMHNEQKALISRLEQQLSDQENNLADAKRIIDKAESQKETITVLEMQVERLKKHLEESNRANEALEVHGVKFSSLSRKIKEQEAEIEAAKDAIRLRDGYLSKIKQLESEVAILQEQVSTPVDDTREHASREFSNAESSHNTDDTELQNVRTQLADKNAIIVSLRLEQQETASQISMLQNTIAEYEETKAQLLTANSEIRSLSVKVEDLSMQLLVIKEERQALANMLEATDANHQSLTSTIESLTAERDSLLFIQTELSASLTSARAAQESAKKESEMYESARSQLAMVTAERDDLLLKMAQVISQLSSEKALSEKLESTRAELDEKQKSITSLEERIAALVASVGAKNEAIFESDRTLSALRKQLQEQDEAFAKALLENMNHVERISELESSRSRGVEVSAQEVASAEIKLVTDQSAQAESLNSEIQDLSRQLSLEKDQTEGLRDQLREEIVLRERLQTRNIELDNIIKELNSEIEGFHKESLETTAQILSLKALQSSLEELNANQANELADSNAAHAALTIKLSQLESELVTQASLLESKQSTIETLEKSIIEYKSSILILESSVAEHESTISSLNAEITSHMSIIETSNVGERSTVQSEQVTQSQTEADIMASMALLQRKIEEQDSELSKLHQSHTEFSAVKSELEIKQSVILTLQKNADEYKSEIEKLELSIMEREAGLKAEIDSQKTLIESLRLKIRYDSEQAAAERENIINALQSKIDEQTSTVSLLQNQIKEQDSAFAQYLNQNMTQVELISKLEQQVSSLKRQPNIIVEQTEVSTRGISDTSDIQALKQLNSKLEADYAACMSNLENEQKTSEAFKSRISDLESRVKKLKSQVDLLALQKERLEAAKKERDESSETLSERRSVISEFESSVSELRDRIEALESERLELSSALLSTQALLKSVQELSDAQSEKLSHLASENDSLVNQLNNRAQDTELVAKFTVLEQQNKALKQAEGKLYVDLSLCQKEKKSFLLEAQKLQSICAEHLQTIDSHESTIKQLKMDLAKNALPRAISVQSNPETFDYDSTVSALKATISRQELEIEHQIEDLAKKESQITLLRKLAEQLSEKINQIERKINGAHNVSAREYTVKTDSSPRTSTEVGVSSLRRAMSQILPALIFNDVPRSDISPSGEDARIKALEGKIKALVDHITAANEELDEVIAENNLLRERLAILIEKKKKGWWRKFVDSLKRETYDPRRYN